jgi:hypothetical protein
MGGKQMSRYSGTPPLDSFGNWLRARRVPCGQTWENQMRKHEGRCMQALRWRHLHVYGSIIRSIPTAMVSGPATASSLDPHHYSGRRKPLSAVANAGVALRSASGLPEIISLAGRSTGQPATCAVSGRPKKIEFGQQESVSCDRLQMTRDQRCR